MRNKETPQTTGRAKVIINSSKGRRGEYTYRRLPAGSVKAWVPTRQVNPSCQRRRAVTRNFWGKWQGRQPADRLVLRNGAADLGHQGGQPGSHKASSPRFPTRREVIPYQPCAQ